MSLDRAQFERLLDEHLAGSLAGDALRQFEALLEAHPGLRAEVDAQRAIHASLRENLKPPHDFAAKALAKAQEAPAVTSMKMPAPKTSMWTRRLAIAAVLILGVFGLWQTWEYLKPGPRPYPDTGPRRTPEAAYHEIIAAGYEPAWICRDDQEFLENVRKSLGEEFLVDQSDPNIRVLGLAYANTLSPWTVMILSYVNDEPVVVYADRKLADHEVPLPESSTLSWHKRELGDVVLYELSPFDEPMILPRIYEPADGAAAPPT